MPDGELTQQDEVQKAIQVLQRYGVVPNRGDSFDVDSGFSEQSPPKDLGTINTLLSNPRELLGLDLTSKQRKNIRSAIVGVGAGFGHNVLSDLFGDEIGGAIGAGLAGWLAKKIVGKE